MKNFIPKNIEELKNKMKKENFRGVYYVKEETLIWNISSEFFLEITLVLEHNECYLTYNHKVGGQEKYLSHEHPSLEELYGLLERINKGPNMLVLKKTLLGKSTKLYSCEIEKDVEENSKNSSNYQSFKF